MGLDPEEEVKQIPYNYSSSFWLDHSKFDAVPKLRKGPHSNNFPILCLLDWTKVYPLELMINYLDKDLHPYILEFDIPMEQTVPYTSMAKDITSNVKGIGY